MNHKRDYSQGFNMLIDSHCHIPHTKYQKSIKEIIEEGARLGVEKFITIGTSLEDSEIALKTAQEYSQIYFSVAIYPNEELKKDVNLVLEELENKFLTSKNTKLIAIGECGIDVSDWENARPIEEQKYLFEEQIKLSIKYDLPIIIHNRNGDEHVLPLLIKYAPLGLRGVIHCFDSSWDFAQKVLDLGFYISFTAMVTYDKKDSLFEVVKNVPTDRFLVETDAPYLSPKILRGQVNYPYNVVYVAQRIAEIKGLKVEEVEKYSYENTCKLFNLCSIL